MENLVPPPAGGDWRQRRGEAGERLAERYLEARELVVIARNFRCRAGELDLICRDADLLVIVEVRQRSGRGFGGALGSVGAAKRRRIIRATQFFLLHDRRWRGHRLRFDVIALQGAPDGVPDIEWVKGAFRGDGAT